MQVTVEGTEIFAATGGRPFDPALPCVLLVHGAGMDHSVWALQSRYLAHRGRAILALDLPGHGRSAGEAVTDIPALGDWLIALLDAVGVAQAALVGHSMGALACLSAAARYPERLRALALLGVAPKMPVHPDLLALAAANDHKALELIDDWAHGPRAHLGGHPAAGTWLLGGGERLLERARPGVLHGDLAACDAYAEGAADAVRVRCPTRLILGADDKMTPAKAGTKLADLIPGAEAVVIPDSGHMMMTEQPDATLEALKQAV
ncbi:alpha/beta fold hydrolase [Algihabitans albus]|uniref:alpha/beta fold hydrolase n=1 Tax=Algihabitans albus TaxID=2164067 RepID=UPI000E5CBB5E|nr:alpha/beta hydrolase [Algihabitans albus]